MTALLAEQTTAEGRIFNDVVALLLRQREENVDSALAQLHAELDAIYNGKSGNIDYAACQMGLAMINFGLGDHAEAKRYACNALQIGGYAEFVAANAVILFSNMGELDLAHSHALAVAKRFHSHVEVLEQVSSVLVDALDFDASADCQETMLKLVTDAAEREMISIRGDRLRSLAAHAKDMGYSASALRARAQCAIDALRDAKQNVFVIQLKGTQPSSLALEFHVGADIEACAELNFVVADALVQKFDDTAVDFVTMSVHAYAGAPRSTDIWSEVHA
ncbi:hypothetical protein M3I53_00980 [Paraburkholderia sp. CNPSo 3272]|uniref:hypothetical protein n=1 Tax=Paraburkholderia sp. CNPSo 3272 TaxID=2940931 RepID=UPI0020B72ED8|nr:hypothetical protein [Paraburkholderia sp. CNPSo 3272]MCP3721710.1 hypothetical protein [Paraburkholderia sp. CNPSo 3272]